MGPKLLLLVLILFAALALPLGWWAALRIALCAMFLLTASGHWGRRRPDLIRMVPPPFPRPDLMVTFTGVCEIAGAIGLLIPMVAPYAAVALTLMLLAIFPANIHAAREKLTIGGTPVTPIVPRTIIQLILVMATIAVAVGAMQTS